MSNEKSTAKEDSWENKISLLPDDCQASKTSRPSQTKIENDGFDSPLLKTCAIVGAVINIPVELITVGPRKRVVNEEALAQIMRSYAEFGPFSPIVVREGQLDSKPAIMLVAGCLRYRAHQAMGITSINATMFEGDEVDALLYEIGDNLHRAELSVLERADHFFEWIRLTTEKGGQGAHPGGKQPYDAGIAKAAKQFRVSRRTVRRAVIVSQISKEARDAAVAAGLGDNQKALLEISSEDSTEGQIARVNDMVSRGRASAATQRQFAGEVSEPLGGADNTSDTVETAPSERHRQLAPSPPLVGSPENTWIEGELKDLANLWSSWSAASLKVRSRFLHEIYDSASPVERHALGFDRLVPSAS